MTETPVASVRRHRWMTYGLDRKCEHCYVIMEAQGADVRWRYEHSRMWNVTRKPPDCIWRAPR